MPEARTGRSSRQFAAVLLCWVVLACGADPNQIASPPIDLDGAPVDPLAAIDTQASVLLFLGTECPISNRYAPEIRRIERSYLEKDVAFWFVYPDPADTPALIRRHLSEYDYAATRVLRDPEHALVAAAGVTRTPEVAVYDRNGRRVYRGRINDRFVEFGRTRPRPTTNELAGALDAVLAGRPVPVAETEAVGCFISDWR
jgi:hypothetical protein